MDLKTLTLKLKRRINNYAVKLFGAVPINTKYKPVGIKKLVPNNDDSIEFLQIRPPYVSSLDLTPEFVSDCSFFSKPEMSVQMDGDYIVTIRNGRMCSYDGSNMVFLTENNFVIDGISFQWDGAKDKLAPVTENKVFKLKGFIKPKKYKGTVFSLLSGGSARYYYYHWMIDSLARLGLLKESGLFNKVDYFLVPNYINRYQFETLEHFGISEDKLINEDFIHHIQADYLIVTSYTEIQFHHPKWACDFLHDAFTKSLGVKKRDRLIYIPRGDAAVNRRVLNEAELIQALKEYGFETRFLSDMTVPEEAAYFNSAKLVLGAQGSGFANLVFCEPGTKVIQFFPSNYVRHIDYDLCNKMGLEYHYLLCPPEGEATNTIEGQKINLYADIPAITAKLDIILNGPMLNKTG